MAGAVKIGAWGPQMGQPGDIIDGSRPQRLDSITICSTKNCILGFSFIYVDQNDTPIQVGPWGNIDTQNSIANIELGSGEHIVGLSGTTDGSGITSLQLDSNQQTTYGPYGFPVGDAFSLPLKQGRGEVVAFFGRFDDNRLKALGVYMPGQKDSPVKVGPWGGNGEPRDINLRNKPKELQSITVRRTQVKGGRIYGFSFTYVDLNGQAIRVGPWGSTIKGDETTFAMNEGEYVNNITGTADGYGVTSLKFTTNKVEYGPFGYPSGNTFSVLLPDNNTEADVNPNGAVVAFCGRSGDSLVAIGAYVGVAPNTET